MPSRELGPSWLCCVSAVQGGGEPCCSAPKLPTSARSLRHRAEPADGLTAPRTGAESCTLLHLLWTRRKNGKRAYLNRTQHGTCFATCRAISAPTPRESRRQAATPPANIQPGQQQGFTPRGVGEAARLPSVGGVRLRWGTALSPQPQARQGLCLRVPSYPWARKHCQVLPGTPGCIQTTTILEP